ncbi:MAG TPA: hypothetical protein VHK67_05860, partial [Rhabdochlamydiaceae bacterium]|nr:hypothetical protein [Rhabdochlamydiaceae bacterium]
QAYQLKFNNSFGLDNQFKLIQCHALLDEAQEKEKKHENGGPLFQQCELLLASVDDDFTSMALDKNELLLRVAHQYVKNDPNHSYQIAQKITSFYDLFKAAQSIQKEHLDFDLNQLNVLYTQAFDAMTKEWKLGPESVSRLLNFNQLLKFAIAFHSVNNHESATRCMTTALKLVDLYENDLVKISTLCQIAEYYQRMGDSQQASSSIESAQQLFQEKIPLTDQIEARLIFANLFYSCKDVTKMDQELSEIMKLMDKNSPLQTINTLYSLTKLIITIGKDETSKSQFKDFAIKPKIDAALEALMTAPVEDATRKGRVRAYLKLVSIYDQGFINDQSLKEQAVSKAFELIHKLPENSDKEIKSKFGLLTSLLYSYKQDPKKALEILQLSEGLYDKCPLNDDSKLSPEKLGWGQQLMSCYHELNLKEQSNRFFWKYLSDLKNEKTPFKKINNLVTYAKHYSILGNIDHYYPEQRRTQLEAAEALLPELKSSNYEHALAMIIKGYLQVDRQKSLRLLENYTSQRAHQRAIKHLKIAAITAATTSLCYFYPQAYPLWTLGLTVVSLF